MIFVPDGQAAPQKTTLQKLSESILSDDQLMQLVQGIEMGYTSGYANTNDGSIQVFAVHKLCIIHISGLDHICIGSSLATVDDPDKAHMMAIEFAMIRFREFNKSLVRSYRQNKRREKAAAKVALEEGTK